MCSSSSWPRNCFHQIPVLYYKYRWAGLQEKTFFLSYGLFSFFTTGCTTKRDSGGKVLYVFFHLLHQVFNSFCSLFRIKKVFNSKTCLLWNQFYYNMTAIWYVLLWKKTYLKLLNNCFVSCDTLYLTTQYIYPVTFTQKLREYLLKN